MRAPVLGLALFLSVGCPHRAPTPAAPAADDLGLAPSAQDLFAAHVRAIGGEEALRAHHSYRMTGRISMKNQGLSSEMVVEAWAPDHMYMSLEMPGVGRMETGYDGTTAWEVNPVTGPRVKTGDELDEARREADFYADAAFDRYVQTWGPVTPSEHEGRPAWQVEVTTPWGVTEQHWFDAQTGLRVAKRSVTRSMLGDMPLLVTMSDYRQVGDLLVPMRLVTLTGPLEIAMAVDAVQYDVAGMDERPLPPEIQELVADQAADPPTE